MQVCDGDGGVLEDHARPHFAEHGGYLCIEGAELREDVVVVGVLVARFDPDLLAGAAGIIARIALLDCLLEEGCSIGIDDYRGPRFLVIHSLADLNWVVIEESGIHSDET